MAAFIAAGALAGWRIERRDETRRLTLPPDVIERYGSLPPSYEAFIAGVNRASSADDGVWFVCEPDLDERDPKAFAWNEIEKMALASATDAAEKQRITSFWDRHFPIMMAPNGDYDYVAIVVTGVGQGSVVHGFAPEWEEVDRVADSFENWLLMLAHALREPGAPAGPLALRVMSRSLAERVVTGHGLE
jgi:hypothetical protein